MKNIFSKTCFFFGGLLIGTSIGIKLCEDDKDHSEEKIFPQTDQFYSGMKEGMEAYKNITDKYLVKNDISDNISVADTDGDHDFKSPSTNFINDYQDDQDDQDNIDEPYIISFDSYMHEYENFSKNTLTYYEMDDTIADEREDVIVDYENYIGPEALDNFGEGSYDPNVVYVRNLAKRSDYEIIRDPGSYMEDVLDISSETTYGNARKFFNLDEIDKE